MGLTYAPMKLIDYTQHQALLPALDTPDLLGAIRALAQAMAAAGQVDDPDLLVDDVLRREQVGSTAMPGGLVLPHAASAGARRVTLGLATLIRPIEVRDDEGQPCQADVVVLLTCPPGQSRAMLWVLARLARAIQGGLVDGLRNAGTQEAMADLLSELA